MAAEFLAKHGIDLEAEMRKIQFGDAGFKSTPQPVDISRRNVPPSVIAHLIEQVKGKPPPYQEDPHSLPIHQFFGWPQGFPPGFPQRELPSVPAPAFSQPAAPAVLPAQPSGPIAQIIGARLSWSSPDRLWDVAIRDGKVTSIYPHKDIPVLKTIPRTLEANGRLLAPSLCHAHIHLDKCFLLQDPKYSDLRIVNGDFQEAMSLTSKAKARFEEEDLLRRGRQLIEESIQHGVTAMRAFVEVDGDVMFKCVDAGIKLKAEFQDRCDIQLCAFAQYALFSGKDGGSQVRKLMAKAAQRSDIHVLGSTPYVETDENKMKMNVRWISSLALTHEKALDLHLDYHLDRSKQPLVFSVIDILNDRNWRRGGKHVTLGHCTRLALFQESGWRRLKNAIGDLPISFVGLPTSDLFMMRTKSGRRGTLPIPEMIQKHGLNAAIAVNNVGNAFTPQGSCDPLSVASLGVGVYQAGTVQDAETLYQSVSSRARAAIGHTSNCVDVASGQPADFVLFDNHPTAWRSRQTIPELVYDAGSGRQTIKGGRLVT